MISAPFRLQIQGFHDPGEAPAPPTGAAGSDAKDVLKVFRHAAQHEPTDPDYHYILGLGFARAGRHADAAAAFQEALSLHREDPEYRYAHGAALWELHRDEEAAEAFRESLRLRPGDVAALNALSCALTRLRREPEAVALFHDAVRAADPPPAILYGNLAVALWQHARSADALRAFRKAVSLDPRSFVLRHNLGLALAAAGRHAEAAEAFRHAVREKPDDVGAHLDLALALYDGAQIDPAGAALETALRLDPTAANTRPRIQELRGALFSRRLKADLQSEARSPSLWHRVGALLPTGGSPAPALRLNVALIALALGGYLTARVLPPYVKRLLLADDVAQIAGAPIPSDDDIRDRLRHAVAQRGLDHLLDHSACAVNTRPKWRRIICRYEVPVVIAPGVRFTARMHIDEERPYLLPPETLQISPFPAR